MPEPRVFCKLLSPGGERTPFGVGAMTSVFRKPRVVQDSGSDRKRALASFCHQRLPALFQSPCLGGLWGWRWRVPLGSPAVPGSSGWGAVGSRRGGLPANRGCKCQPGAGQASCCWLVSLHLASCGCGLIGKDNWCPVWGAGSESEKTRSSQADVRKFRLAGVTGRTPPRPTEFQRLLLSHTSHHSRDLTRGHAPPAVNGSVTVFFLKCSSHCSPVLLPLAPCCRWKCRYLGLAGT